MNKTTKILTSIITTIAMYTSHGNAADIPASITTTVTASDGDTIPAGGTTVSAGGILTIPSGATLNTSGRNLTITGAGSTVRIAGILNPNVSGETIAANTSGLIYVDGGSIAMNNANQTLSLASASTLLIKNSGGVYINNNTSRILPSGGDSLIWVDGGTITATNNSANYGINLTDGSSINITNDGSTTGSVTLNGGQLLTTGTMTISNGGSFTINDGASAQHRTNSATTISSGGSYIINSGGITSHNNNTITTISSGGSYIANSGSTIQSGATPLYIINSAGTFDVNTASFYLGSSTTSGTKTININGGTLNVNNGGTINSGGGVGGSAGSINVNSGTLNVYSGGTILNSYAVGTGSITVNGGTLYLRSGGTITHGNASSSNASLTVNSGTFQFDSGTNITKNTSGTSTCSLFGTSIPVDGSNKYLNNGTLTIPSGTTTIPASSSLISGSGSSLIMQPSSEIILSNNATITTSGAASLETLIINGQNASFNNYGPTPLNISSELDVSGLNSSFNNHGTVSLSGGPFHINGQNSSLNNYGTTSLENSSELDVSGLNSSFNNHGTVSLSGGSLQIGSQPSSFNNYGTLNIVSVSSAIDVTSNGTMNNQSQLLLAEGILHSHSGSTFNNYASFTCLYGSTFLYAPGTFNNFGTFNDLSQPIVTIPASQIITIPSGTTMTIPQTQQLSLSGTLINESSTTIEIDGNFYVYGLLQNGDGISPGVINVNYPGNLYLLSGRLTNGNAGSITYIKSGGSLINYFGTVDLLTSGSASLQLQPGGIFTNVRGNNPGTFTISTGGNFFDSSIITLNDNLEIDQTWTITQQAIINGAGNKIIFGPNGNIFISGSSASLLLDNVIVENVSAMKIHCSDNNTTLSLHNIIWDLDDSFTFTKGSLYVSGEWLISGTKEFQYESDQFCTITSNAIIHFLNSSCNYNSLTPDRFFFQDQTSIMHLEQATIHALTNCSLANGTLITSGVATFQGDATIDLHSLSDIQVQGAIRRIGNVII